MQDIQLRLGVVAHAKLRRGVPVTERSLSIALDESLYEVGFNALTNPSKTPNPWLAIVNPNS
jgi:hypothetical protein